MTWLPRALGAVTTTYGAAILVRPELLLGPSGLLRGDRADAEQAMFVRTLGVRDLASGLAMVFARGRKATRVAIAVRVASDVGDAVVLGRALRGKPERGAVLAVAGGWAGLCALAALTTRK
ncbi:DUF4267 domain-containing protein [Actinophytocola xanthii]|uniref:DUF4267 domain-containing protein n=1 Tax=Actinophytocola xanthii TaxID=1912961 RepID=A0A1Q8CTZ8_9PSEU|nr:DUF4267 domain-containing protein [Actinophytocola xanthii]OLF17823.1 hypothetical protein BU204_10120 [Actinophytocola xanthii]